MGDKGAGMGIDHVEPSRPLQELQLSMTKATGEFLFK